MIALFTDYGWNGPYVGQLHAVLAAEPTPPVVIDLMHDAPRCNPRAASVLLAALAPWLPTDTVFVAVVDPGVGSARRGLVVEADGQCFVGPDNGLLEVVSARAERLRWWRIDRLPSTDSATFHGRDLFVPVAAEIARSGDVPGVPIEPAPTQDAADDLAEVVYLDDFGNAATGLRPPPSPDYALEVGGHKLPRARTFADVPVGAPMWLVNSVGLVEIAVNQGDAAARLALEIGSPVRWQPPH